MFLTKYSPLDEFRDFRSRFNSLLSEWETYIYMNSFFFINLKFN